MTALEFKKARLRLGLTTSQLASVLGMEPVSVRRMEVTDEDAPSRRPVGRQVELLMRAFAAGYRPPNWPEPFYEVA